MSDLPSSFPFENVAAACERAACYRRQVAIDAGAPARNVAERIDVVADGAIRPDRADGWYRIGTVYDGVVNQELRVVWHPETDRVRVGRPVVPALEPKRRSGMPALSFNVYGARDYRADPNFRYFLNGREYTPAEALRIVRERDSVAGWTWEPVDEVVS